MNAFKYCRHEQLGWVADQMIPNANPHLMCCIWKARLNRGRHAPSYWLWESQLETPEKEPLSCLGFTHVCKWHKRKEAIRGKTLGAHLQKHVVLCNQVASQRVQSATHYNSSKQVYKAFQAQHVQQARIEAKDQNQVDDVSSACAAHGSVLDTLDWPMTCHKVWSTSLYIPRRQTGLSCMLQTWQRSRRLASCGFNGADADCTAAQSLHYRSWQRPHCRTAASGSSTTTGGSQRGAGRLTHDLGLD